jgi:hypothetical protein
MSVRLLALRSDRALPPKRYLVLFSVKGWIKPRVKVRLEELRKVGENPVTSSVAELGPSGLYLSQQIFICIP